MHHDRQQGMMTWQSKLILQQLFSAETGIQQPCHIAEC